jgi:hypothetical protein
MLLIHSACLLPQVSPDLHEAVANSVLALQDSEADQGRFTRVYYRLMQAAIKQAATHGPEPILKHLRVLPRFAKLQ